MPKARSSTRTPRPPGTPGDGDSYLCLPLRTVTPVFGGGYKPAELDDVDPVRVPGIRGQLRFFWRALYGHECQSAAELAEREAALWGGASSRGATRSRVDLWVSNVLGIGDGHTDSSPLQGETAGYVLWPAGLGRGKGEDWAPRRRPGMRFRLHVRVAVDARDREAEVLASLNAWLLFGGIGSRVRRGCGSLALDVDAIKTDRLAIEPRDWLPARADEQAVDAVFRQALGAPCLTGARAAARETPSLRGARMLSKDPLTDAQEAWERAVLWLKEFRVVLRSNGSSKKIETKNRPDLHAPLLTPAANLGLPVVNLGEDPNARLLWRDGRNVAHDRLASPLIIKPLALLHGKFAPVALWLHRGDLDGDVVWKRGDAGDGEPTGVAPRPVEELRDRFAGVLDQLDEAARKSRKGGRSGGQGGRGPRGDRMSGRPPRNRNKRRNPR